MSPNELLVHAPIDDRQGLAPEQFVEGAIERLSLALDLAERLGERVLCLKLRLAITQATADLHQLRQVPSHCQH